MSFSTVTSQGASQTAVAMAIWSYSPRSLTDIQNLISAIQNNNPSLVSAYPDLVYIPVVFYSNQASTTQVAGFVDNLIRNYGQTVFFDNTIMNNPYNLWTTNFITNLSINPYLTVTSLTMLLSSPYLDGNHAQEILYSLSQNYYYNKLIQTLTAGYGSTTISTNVTINTSPIFAQSLTISSGVTITCGLNICYFITQQFNNYGTIVNQNGGIGGTGGTGGGGNGGTGGGGIVVLALTSALGTLNVNGNIGAVGQTASSGSSGLSGGTGILFLLGTSVPVGGNGGVNNTSGGGGGAILGAGGNTVGAGGTGGAVTLYTFSNGNSMLTYIMQGVSDWWTINVLGKPPSSTTPLYNIYNAGGGGGGSYVSSISYAGGGGGGGAGGEVIVYSYNFISSNISANGQAGGAGGAGGANGGGGAGGLIYVFYGSTSGSLTLSVAGGTGANTGSTGIATTIQVTVNG